MDGVVQGVIDVLMGFVQNERLSEELRMRAAVEILDWIRSQQDRQAWRDEGAGARAAAGEASDAD